MPPTELATSLVVTDDDRLAAAEALVRAFCGWHIAPVRQSTMHASFADGTVVLPTLHLVSVDSVVTDDGTVLDPSTYRTTESGVLRRVYPTFWQSFTHEPFHWWGVDEVAVTFTHGYDEPPPEVTAAVVAIAQQAKAALPGLKSKSTGPFSETFMAGEDPLGQYRDVLTHYRLPARP